MSAPRSRLIAFYLPQYHPIPENDAWWGAGFTEWTNVSRARPLFAGHNQPRLPADLGFYDLRLPEVREQQAELARRYGIHGFCYYYYWFDNGKRLLERPLEEMFKSGRPDFPFCLCWANENWSRRWDGQERQILMQQVHSPENDLAFLRSILPYMRDRRYIRVDGKPLLVIYRSTLFPDIAATVRRWREEMARLGEPDLYLVAAESFDVAGDAAIAAGFDALCEFPPHQTGGAGEVDAGQISFNETFTGRLVDYQRIVDRFLARPEGRYKRFRTVMLEWDNTARRKSAAHVFVNYSVAGYHRWLRESIDKTSRAERPDERLVFINAWNEWAEGTYLEPDARNGHRALEATLAALEDRDWAPAGAELKAEPAAPSAGVSLQAAAQSAGPTSSDAAHALRLISVTEMDNHADIAEAFVRANARFFDSMHIILHGASDGTAEILDALRNEGMPITVVAGKGARRDPEQAVNQLVREILAASAPDWIAPLGPDEFIDARDRPALEQALLANGPRHARVSRIRHVATGFDAAGDINPVSRLKHRYDYETPAPDVDPSAWKTFVNVALFKPYLDRYQLSRGGHRIELLSLHSESKQPNRPLGEVRIRHFPVRSYDQLLVARGLAWARRFLAGGSMADPAREWEQLRGALSEIGLTQAELLQRATRRALDSGPAATDIPGATPIVLDPFPLDVALRYGALRKPAAFALIEWIRGQLLGDLGQGAMPEAPALEAAGRKKHVPRVWKSLSAIESEQMAPYYHDKPRTELLPMLGDPGARLLDIGCGAGATSHELKKRFPRCHATGIELNQNAAKAAAGRLDIVISANIESMPLPDPRLPDGGFDTILCADVLEHLVSPWHLMLRLHALLKPDGRLIACIPNVYNLALIDSLAQGAWNYAADGLLDITHLRFFTLDSMKTMFEETGYQIVDIKGLKQNSAELPPYEREGLSNLSTEFVALRKLAPDQVDQLLNLQYVVTARRASNS